MGGKGEREGVGREDMGGAAENTSSPESMRVLEPLRLELGFGELVDAGLAHGGRATIQR